MPHKSENRCKFGSRLALAIASKGLLQNDLAKNLDVSTAAVSGWIACKNLPDPETMPKLCRFLEVSADYLLGLVDEKIKPATNEPNEFTQLSDQLIHHKNGVKWLAYVPDYVQEDREFLIKAIENVRLTIEYKASPKDRKEKLSWSESVGVASTIRALRLGCIKLLSVETDSSLENKVTRLYEKHGLLEAIVVKPVFSSGLLQAEMVAFRAMQRLFGKLPHTITIGVGSGYTMLRMAELIFTNNTDGNQLFLPLTEFKEKSSSENIGVKAVSADHIVKIIQSRFPGSKIYSADDETHNVDQLIMTVNGFGRGFDDDGTFDQMQFRTVNQMSIKYIRSIYNELGENAGKVFGGEILGWIISKDGTALELGTENVFSSLFTLDQLRNHSQTKRTWIVASRAYKALSTAIAVKTGLANSLIIDSEIADILIKLEDNISI